MYRYSIFQRDLEKERVKYLIRSNKTFIFIQYVLRCFVSHSLFGVLLLHVNA